MARWRLKSRKRWRAKMKREFANERRHEQWIEAIRQHKITGLPIVNPPAVDHKNARRAASRERKALREAQSNHY
eukprot:10339715-Karenia_brevis.AAC.1